MSIIRQLIQSPLFVMFTAFGAASVLAMPLVASDFHYALVQNHITEQSTDIAFAARAPPIAGQGVAFAGVVVIEQGNRFALYGQATVVALRGFGGYLNVTNSGGRITNNYGPLNEGPLPNDIADTFRGGTYSEVVTTEPTKHSCK